MDYLLVISLLSVLPTILLWNLYTSRRRKGLPLPPGPKPYPIIGNAFDLVSEYACLTYAEWKKTYGDIIHVSAFGQPIIIINGYKAAMDLLTRKSIYSDRITQPMVGELMGWDRFTPGVKYGDLWREHRRLINSVMNKTVVHRFWPVQLAEARVLLKSLLHSPEDFLAHIRASSGRVIMHTTYGIPPGEKQNEYIELARKAMHYLSQAAPPGTYLVDALPFLKYVPSWVPGAQFKRDAVVWKQMGTDMATLPYEHTKRDIAAGIAPPSFVQSLLEGQDLTPKEDEVLKFTAGTLFLAAADTTVSSLSSFFLAMTLFPDVQRRAQEEIDAIVGQRVLPTFEDRPNLPYINALLKELVRWAPVIPLAVPHRLTEDDVYEGYFIPKGSLVMGNIWAISHDTTIYPDPRRFSPERFLKTEKDAPQVVDPYSYFFGFGRRMCPGMWFADSAMFITIVSVLHAFTISKPLDENGMEYTPLDKSDGAHIAHPLPFKCRITPRFETSVTLILAEPDEAEC